MISTWPAAQRNATQRNERASNRCDGANERKRRATARNGQKPTCLSAHKSTRANEQIRGERINIARKRTQRTRHNRLLIDERKRTTARGRVEELALAHAPLHNPKKTACQWHWLTQRSYTASTGASHCALVWRCGEGARASDSTWPNVNSFERIGVSLSAIHVRSSHTHARHSKLRQCDSFSAAASAAVGTTTQVRSFVRCVVC